jgi:hypothetical protein
MGMMFLTCLNVIGAIGRRRSLTSGLDLEVVPQSVQEEPPQDCEFL